MEPGEDLGKYRLEALIGRGGGGDVFRAVQRGIGGFSRPVAVKILHGAAEMTGDSVDKLAREARIIGRLQHRNIVQVHEVAEALGIYFLVMELVDGVTLKGLMRAHKAALPFWVGIHAGAEICRALRYAHEAADELGQPLGIVHRDIKPSNVLISNQGDIKLSDFGLAKASRVKADHLTAHGVIKGTPAYMSPEQRAGVSATAAADVFSLAVMVYEACSGARPSVKKAARHTPVPSLAALNPAVPHQLDEVLTAALLPKANRRPSATVVGQVLEQTLTAVVPPDKLSRLSEETAVWVNRALKGLWGVSSHVATNLAPRRDVVVPAPGDIASPPVDGNLDPTEVSRSARSAAAAPAEVIADVEPAAAVRQAAQAPKKPVAGGAGSHPRPRRASSASLGTVPREPPRPAGVEVLDPSAIAQVAAELADEEVDVGRDRGQFSLAPDLTYAGRAQRTQRRVFALVIIGIIIIAAFVLWQEMASDWGGKGEGAGAADVQPEGSAKGHERSPGASPAEEEQTR